MRLDRTTLVCVTAMGAMFFAPCDVDAQLTGKPNVLIIVTDDQGYADLSTRTFGGGCANAKHGSSCETWRAVHPGLRFGFPVCSPSRAGWNTGRHQVRWDPRSSFACGLPDGTPHLAAILKKHGYATAKFGKNDYGGKTMHRKDVFAYPLNHGYDEFLGFSAHGHDFFLLTEDIRKRTPDPRGHSAVVGPMQQNRGDKDFANGYLTEIFTDAAIDFMQQERGQPFYLTLSYNAVHHLIHQSPKHYLDKYGVKEIPNYDPDKDGSYAKWFNQYITLGKITAEEMRTKYYLANLNCLDDNIGRVLNALDELKLTDNTLVVFFSDNGGPPTNGAWNRPLAGSKFTLWEGGIGFPFILSRPNDPNAGQETWDQVVSTLDVVPTVLQAMGIALPEGLDGRPIVKSDASRDLFWRFNESHAVRSGDWKLLHNGGKHRRVPTSGIVNRGKYLEGTRLFNLVKDRGESQDLAEEHSDIVRRLQRLYLDWSNEVADNGKGTP